jgi:hypothetical protein
MKKIAITSLTFFMASAASAEQVVVVPTLEGGLTASIGTFYATPSTGDYNYANNFVTYGGAYPESNTPVYNTTDYDFGWEVSLGYVFEETANGVELSYRGLHSSSDASTISDGSVDNIIAPPGGGVDNHYASADNKLTYDFDTIDLMFSQFVDFGNYVQMRFSGGLAYAFIKQKSHTDFVGDGTEGVQNTESKFQGLGPRVGSDGRYDFGDGFGIVGGASLAYLLGKLDSSNEFYDVTTNVKTWDYHEDVSNHAVLNVRANLGVDYVYFFNNDEGSTLGLEVGYLADYYVEAVNEITGGYEAQQYGPSSVLQSASFAGPYVNLKGVF